MKYYVNAKSKMLGTEETTFWLISDTFQDGLDPNFELRFDVCLQNFQNNVHTVEYDDETNTILQIDNEGRNFVGTLEETPEMQTFVDMFHEFKEQKQRADEIQEELEGQ